MARYYMPSGCQVLFLTFVRALAIAASLAHVCSLGSAAEVSEEHLNTSELMIGSSSAFSAGQLEDAGFLFYAAQIRYEVDKQVYPPTALGGNSPGVLKAALSFSIGQAVVPAVTSESIVHANVVRRLLKWSPKFSDDYDPGWEYQKSLDGQARGRIVASTREAVLAPLQHKLILLGNEEYRRLTKELGATQEIVQRYGLAVRTNRGDESVPKSVEAEYQAASVEQSVIAERLKQIEWELVPASRWHNVVKWNAEDYFDSPEVIQLCKAIELNDVLEMNHLIAKGADINTVGKDGMTPLLWAFPDRKLERFECLLQAGANPNVFITVDFNTGNRQFHFYPENEGFLENRGCHAGQTVTHLACRSPVIEYMQLVFSRGGDPNLVDKKTGEEPLGIVLSPLMPDKKERVEILLRQKCDPNSYCKYRGGYAASLAVQSHAYDAALLLLQAGADPSLASPTDQRTIVHWLLLHEEYLPFSDPKRTADYHALVDWLTQRGAQFDEARTDLDRKGQPWGKALKEQRDQELARFQSAAASNTQEKLAKLQALKGKREPAPETAADWVEKLNRQELRQIELPSDSHKKAFVMYQMMSMPSDRNRLDPWVTIYADGRILCRSRTKPTAESAEGMLDKDELVWLMHLAVNKCKILEQRTADFEQIENRVVAGLFKYEVAVKTGSNEFQLPLRALVSKAMRRDFGLDEFKNLHTFVGYLANRTHLGGEADGMKVLEVVNSELQKQHPELPLFQMHHLSVADRGDGSRFLCGFSREIDLGDKHFLQVTANYVDQGGHPQVVFNVRDYHKYR